MNKQTLDEFNHLEHAKDEFIKLTNAQAEKGKQKYNQPLDPYETGRNWLDMEAQELVDAWQYNRSMQSRLLLVTSKIRELSAVHCDAGANEEIIFWLDFLEGK